MSLEDNLLITGHRRRELSAGPFLNPSKSKRWADERIARFEIRAGSSRDPVSSLSGGNQQKVVVARALDETPELLVAVNPTRGLDLKATVYVHRQILAARDAGAAVVLITTDLDELSLLASRRFFLSRGTFVEGEDAAALLGGAE
jgi:simple sugar transport system ATP-binding protein